MRTRTRAAAAAFAAVVVAAGTAAGPASSAISQVPAEGILSPGPLWFIEVTPELRCMVQHVDDRGPAFFAETACATLLSIDFGDRTLFGPAEIPGWDQYPDLRSAWRAERQVLTGSGTSEDPYLIETVIDYGEFAVVETDSYIVGDDFYLTDIEVRNRLSSSVDMTIYHAGDCQVADSDVGLGSYAPDTGAVTCHAVGPSGGIEAGGRALSFIPLTPGSTSMYGEAIDVWSVIGVQEPFPDDVRRGDTPIDSAIGLSWSVRIESDSTARVSLLTSLAPTEVLALPSEVSLSADSLDVGDAITVSATVRNPNAFTQAIDPLTATLPPGVEYVEGSAGGAPEPAIDGRTLDFGTVTIAGGQSFDFRFAVAGTAEGTGRLAVGGETPSGATVVPASGTLTVNAVSTPSSNDTGGSEGEGEGGFDPTVLLWGGLAALLVIGAVAATVAFARAPRRVQRKLVRNHVRLDPQRATTIHHPPPPDSSLPAPPTFRLDGKGSTWTHSVTEEQP